MRTSPIGCPNPAAARSPVGVYKRPLKVRMSLTQNTMTSSIYEPQPSTWHRLIALCALALVIYQAFRRFETFDIKIHLILLCAPIFLGFGLLKDTVPWHWAVLISILTFSITIVVALALYRLSPFHPLARYPGPTPCKLSKFWMAYISLGGYQHLYIKDLHDCYGDIVRIGPNELSLRDPSILNAMMGPGGLPRGPYLAGRALTATDLPIVAIMDPSIHAERRKPWARAFSSTALKEYAPMIANRVQQLVHVLEQQQGHVVIGKFFNYFAYDFMCDMAYGGGSELLRDGDTDNVWHIIEEGLPGSTFISHVPYMGFYLGHLPIFRPAVDRLLSHSKQFTLRRLKRGSELKDIFHYLNNEDQPGKAPPPMKHLLDDGVVAIIAGADTASSALTSLVFCLLTHPYTFKRLQAEIDQFYPAEENACDPKHHREMHYLTAVIHETLRLYPPVPGGTQRRVPHGSDGIMLGTYPVPGGTTVILPPYTLHRDPRNFSPFPEDFWPERWLIAAQHTSLENALAGSSHKLADASPLQFVHNEAAFMPFSYGPANCVGKQLAMQEMRTVMTALIQRFDLQLRDGWDVREYDKGFKDYYVTTRPEVPVMLQARF
ncbi:high nitrogen upregulated cytochrome P450 monooxygenase 2 [Trametes sanguinea]|nr:high nitrogen upregulated cytochrome P450 monooxygenase 2 [Trametes sanguinea]